MVLAPALTVVVPVTTAAAFCVIAPPVLSVRLVALMASRASALMSVIATAPPVAPRLPKLLPAFASVTAPVPALTAVAPETMAAAFCVTLPLPAFVLTVRLVALIALRASALASVIDTAPLATPMVAKSLPAFVSVTAPLPAVMVVVPVTTAAPLCVSAPLPALESSVSVVALIGPSTRPLSSRTLIAPPVATKVAKLLPAWVSVIAPLPALAVVVPAAVIDRAVWLIAEFVVLSARLPSAVMSWPRLRPVAPVRLTSVPRRSPNVAKPAPALIVRFAEPVSMLPLRPLIDPVTAVRLRSLLGAGDRLEISRLFASVMRLAPPVTAIPNTLLKSLPTWVSVTSPDPALIVVSPVVALIAPAVCVMALLVDTRFRVPARPVAVRLLPSEMPALPVREILVALIAPVEERTPVVLAVSVPLAVPASPRPPTSASCTVPPETMLTFEKLSSGPSSVTAPIPAVTVVVPVATIVPMLWLTAAFVVVRLSAPPAVMSLPIVTPVAPVRLMLLPTSVPGVASGPPLDSVRSPAPVLMPDAGRLSAPPAITLTL